MCVCMCAHACVCVCARARVNGRARARASSTVPDSLFYTLVGRDNLIAKKKRGKKITGNHNRMHSFSTLPFFLSAYPPRLGDAAQGSPRRSQRRPLPTVGVARNSQRQQLPGHGTHCRLPRSLQVSALQLLGPVPVRAGSWGIRDRSIVGRKEFGTGNRTSSSRFVGNSG